MFTTKEKIIAGLFTLVGIVIMYFIALTVAYNTDIENNVTPIVECEECVECPVCTPEVKTVYQNQTVYINDTKWLPCNQTDNIKLIRQIKWCEKELDKYANITNSTLLDTITDLNASLKLNISALDACKEDLCNLSGRTRGCKEGAG